MRHLCGGGAWPDNEPARQATHQHTRPHWCGGRRRAWPDNEPAHQATHQHTRPHWCGGRRRAWPRCRWAAAGPGRAIHSDLAPLVWRAPEGLAAVPVGGGGAWPGTPEPQAPPVWRAPEGTEGTGGLRGAAPNEVRTPSLAGGRARRRPEHPRRHKQRKRAAAHRAAARSRSQWSTQRSRAATTSATWTAFRAAPLRRLSPETTRTRPRLPSTAWS